MVQEYRSMVQIEGQAGPFSAYLACPEGDGPHPGVIVIHEIFGLSSFIKDVAGRFADQGYVALAPDLFSRLDLADVLTADNIGEAMKFRNTLPPQKLQDRSFMQEALAQLPDEQSQRIQKVIPLVFGGQIKEPLTQDLVRAFDYLRKQEYVIADRIGVVGFCFGGGLSINLACEAPVSACVVFYGENPIPIERVEKIPCPVLGIYGADDQRVNPRLPELVGAMVQYKKDFEMRIYPGAGHAFFNDTNPAIYRPEAAKDAWDRVLRFYFRTLQPG
jgi:carboxymethylenebutenolidase